MRKTSTSPPPRGVRDQLAQARRAALPVFLFALSFMIAASAISISLRPMEPEPDFLVLSPKLEHFRDNHAQINTVFLGTSRTLYHVVPAEIESAAAAAGCDGLRVYNFGIFGLNGAEQDWLINEILSTPGLDLNQLIIEDPLPAERRFDDVTSERARYFHQPGLYRAIADDIASFPESFPKRVFRFGIFGFGASYDLSGIGRASKVMFPPAKTKSRFTFDFSLQGFEALDTINNSDIEARRANFEGQPGQFLGNIAAYDLGPESATAARARYHFARLTKIEKAGIASGLFISPDSAELRRTPWIGKEVQRTQPEALVLNYNLPNQFADLFERERWFDFSHLNESGARLLSQKIGTQLCQHRSLSPSESQDD